MSVVAFSWALRDAVAGKRGWGLAVAALLPTLLLLAVFATGERLDGGARADAAVALTTTVITPFILGLVAIVTSGSVLRRPVEEGTLIYQLARPQRRALLGVVRGLAVGLSTAAVGALSLLTLGAALAAWSLVLDALLAVVLGGLAFGLLYGLVVSLHRYALGVAVLHLVAEAALARVPFRVNQATVTWHLWGAMGSLGEHAVEMGSIPPMGGTLLVPLVVGATALALTGVLFRVRQFGLGIGEQ